MHVKEEILDQFIMPNGNNKGLSKAKITQFFNQILTFLSKADNKPTYPNFEKFGAEHFELPDVKLSIDEISFRVQELLDHSMNAANPKYIGHMDSIPTVWSIIGDCIASAINNNLLSLEMSPFLTQLEYSLTKQFSSIFGLPEGAGGIMLSGGSLSNLQALVVARNISMKSSNGDISSIGKSLVIFASSCAHSSIQKAAMILGIGSTSVIQVKTDQNSRMCPSDLERKIAEQKALGKVAIAVVATAGTTVTGNIDKLPEIYKITRKNQIWLHVDAIYGGAVILSDKHKYLIEGIEHADSIAFNPQKWFYIAKTCSMVLFKDFSEMAEAFRVSAPYMKEQNSFINIGEISIQGTKYAEVIKLWLSLLGLGKAGVGELIDFSFYISTVLISEVEKREYLKCKTDPQLNIVCFRGEPGYLPEDCFDEWNKNLQTYLIEKTNFFLSLPNYEDSLWLRAVLLNPFTTTEHVIQLFDEIDIFYNNNDKELFN